MRAPLANAFARLAPPLREGGPPPGCREGIAGRGYTGARARCGGEASQIHGGIGMTDEEEIDLLFERVQAAELTLGDAIYHRDRYARLR